jgi:hypothetical protein
MAELLLMVFVHLTYKNLDNLILSITKKGQEIVPFLFFLINYMFFGLMLYIYKYEEIYSIRRRN